MAALGDKKTWQVCLTCQAGLILWHKDAGKEGYFHKHQHHISILIPFPHFRNRQKICDWYDTCQVFVIHQTPVHSGKTCQWFQQFQI
jgi:hypothetical protein